LETFLVLSTFIVFGYALIFSIKTSINWFKFNISSYGIANDQICDLLEQCLSTVTNEDSWVSFSGESLTIVNRKRGGSIQLDIDWLGRLRISPPDKLYIPSNRRKTLTRLYKQACINCKKKGISQNIQRVNKWLKDFIVSQQKSSD
jgi:hypothetical protein